MVMVWGAARIGAAVKVMARKTWIGFITELRLGFLSPGIKCAMIEAAEVARRGIEGCQERGLLEPGAIVEPVVGGNIPVEREIVSIAGLLDVVGPFEVDSLRPSS